MSGRTTISKLRRGRAGSNLSTMDKNELLDGLRKKRQANLDVLFSQKNPAKKTSRTTPMEEEEDQLDSEEAGPSNIETSNRFNPLINVPQSDDNLEEGEVPQNVKAIKSYTPPIIIQNFTYKQVCDVLKSFKITVFTIKIMNIGIKISNLVLAEYTLFKEYLVNGNIQHYTHSTPDKFPLKVILAGHPYMDVDFVKAGIVDSGIKPESIIEIIPLRKKDVIHPSHISYLVKFAKSAVRFHDLRKIRFVNNVVINWYPYKNKRQGPTQCRKCQLFGHGESNCFRRIKCPECSQDHSIDNCPRADEEPFKCANCGEDHRSSDPECRKRLEYIYIKENMSISKEIDRVKSSRALPKRDYVVFRSNARNHQVFPNLPEPQQSTTRRSFFNTFDNQQDGSSMPPRFPAGSRHRSGSEASFSQVTSPRHQHLQSNQRVNQQDERQSHFSQFGGDNSKKSDLFTVEELGSLITDISQIISSCETRVQQFEAIALLSLKYFYNACK